MTFKQTSEENKRLKARNKALKSGNTRLLKKVAKLEKELNLRKS